MHTDWTKAWALFFSSEKHTHTHTNADTHTWVPFISLISLIWTGKNGRKEFHPQRLSCVRLRREWDVEKQTQNNSIRKKWLECAFHQPNNGKPHNRPQVRPMTLPVSHATKGAKKKKSPKLTPIELWAMSVMIPPPSTANPVKLTDTMTTG